MKKSFLKIILTLIIMFCLTGCNSKEERALENFFDASSLEADINIKAVEDKKSVEITLCNMAINEEALSLYIYDLDTTISYDQEESILYYKNGNKKYYSIIEEDILNSSPISTRESSEEEDVDIMDYITNIQYLNNTYSFDLDVEKLLLENLSELDKTIIEQLDIDVINCFGTFENDSVNSFSMDFTSMISMLETMGYSFEGKLILSLENIKYEEVKPLDGINKASYKYVSNTELIQNIILDLDFPQNDNNNVPPTPTSYHIGWCETNYTIRSGETLKLNGYLYDNNYNSISFENCQITYSPELDLTKSGMTQYDLTISYNGHTLYQTIKVNVIASKQSEGLINVIESGITKTFQLDNYLLVADNKNLYKFNLDTNLVEGSVRLDCQANSIYVKDGYVYVAANYPPFQSNDNWGTISKVKFSDFTLEKQMEVEFYPYSIFVDKRGDVVVGKGEDQHLMYSIINLETETVSDLVSGYEMDYLVYSEVRDAFMAITPSHTGGNDWYKYNGVTYSQIDDESDILSRVDYVYNNGEILIQANSWSSNLIVGKFHNGLNDYRYMQYSVPHIDHYVDYTKVTYFNDKVYYLASNNDSFNATLVEFDLITEKSITYYINVLKPNIEGIYCYNDKIYICYYDGSVLDVFPMN